MDIQIQRQYLQADFSEKTAGTGTFRAMRETMGPAKII